MGTLHEGVSAFGTGSGTSWNQVVRIAWVLIRFHFNLYKTTIYEIQTFISFILIFAFIS